MDLKEEKKSNTINRTFTSAFTQELKELIQEVVYDNINQKPLEKLYTKHEAAEYFEVSTITIDRWRKSGRLKDSKIGGKVKFKESDLIQALNNH